MVRITISVPLEWYEQMHENYSNFNFNLRVGPRVVWQLPNSRRRLSHHAVLQQLREATLLKVHNVSPKGMQ